MNRLLEYLPRVLRNNQYTNARKKAFFDKIFKVSLYGQMKIDPNKIYVDSKEFIEPFEQNDFVAFMKQARGQKI